MKLIIDATNIKSGGGLTHLNEILSFDYAVTNGFEQVIVFAPENTLKKLPTKYWLRKETHSWINKNYIYLLFWKLLFFRDFIKKNNHLVFIPGTGYCIYPYVTMCRNLLPLEFHEINRFFPSKEWLRLITLRYIHIFSYKKAYGIIFLNNYCKNVVHNMLDFEQHTIIPHGLNQYRFTKKINLVSSEFNMSRPLKLIYVSTINLYKHQWLIAKAVDELNKDGLFIELTLIGDKQSNAYRKFNDTLKRLQFPDCVNYLGSVEYEILQKFYCDSDVFVFPSTCETFGNVILEAMSCGLPILCSKYSSMPSTFENVPIYFDPYDIESMKNAIASLYENPLLIQELSEKSVKFSQNFSWENTSIQTFEYLSSVSKHFKNTIIK
jgi:glycosyltransferase involved in cell wall biosynthesis